MIDTAWRVFVVEFLWGFLLIGIPTCFILGFIWLIWQVLKPVPEPSPLSPDEKLNLLAVRVRCWQDVVWLYEEPQESETHEEG